jgi:hypothetical protein
MPSTHTVLMDMPTYKPNKTNIRGTLPLLANQSHPAPLKPGAD